MIPHSKFFYCVILGWNIAPAIYYFEKYIFKDWEFGAFLFVAFLLDTTCGFYKHCKFGTVSREGWAKMRDKMFICCTWLVLIHLMTNYGLHGAWAQYFRTFGNSSIMVFFALSVMQNLSEITNGKYPPKWILNKLKTFNQKGKL